MTPVKDLTPVQEFIINFIKIVGAVSTLFYFWRPQWLFGYDPIRYKFHRRKKSAIIKQIKVVASATFKYYRENNNYPTVEELREIIDRRLENSSSISTKVKFLVVVGEWTSWDNPTGIFEERPVLNFENSALFLCVAADESNSDRPQIDYLNVDDKASFIENQFKPIDKKWFGGVLTNGLIFLIKKDIPLRTLYRFMEFRSSWGYGDEGELKPFAVAKEEYVGKK